MKNLEAVVLFDADYAIARQGQQIIYIPDDLKHFKELTTGHPVIMGRKTAETILEKCKGPLPNRTNIVLTAAPREVLKPVSESEDGNGRITVELKPTTHDTYCKWEELGFEVGGLMEVLNWAALQTTTSFIIGGGSIYRQLVPFCSVIHATEVQAHLGGDKLFAPFATKKGRMDWEEISRSETFSYYSDGIEIPYQFVDYKIKDFSGTPYATIQPGYCE